MPKKLIYVGQDDEISDLISKVREAEAGDEVALVLPADAHVFQTPLNVRLLNQFTARQNRPTAIVSADPRIQQLARASGFPTYASVVAYERGVEMVEPHAGDEAPMLRGGGTATGHGATGVATATRPAPTRLLAPPPSPPGKGRIPPAVPGPGRRTGRDRRRPLYFGLIGVGIIGLLLFLVLSPSARITVTISAVAVTASPTIQGTPDPTEAKQAEHILTTVVTSTGSNTLKVTPSGTRQVAAIAATGQVSMQLLPGSQFFTTGIVFTGANAVPAATQFTTSDVPPIVFATTQATSVTIPPGGGFSNPLPVQAISGGQSANSVAIGAINQWPQCAVPTSACSTWGIRVANLQKPSGGVEAKSQVVASSADLQSWNTQITQMEQVLTDAVNKDFTTKAQGKTFAVDPNGGGKTIAFTLTPPLPNAGDQFAAATITIAVNAKAALYDIHDVRVVLLADLRQQVPAGEVLTTDNPDALTLSTPSIIQASDDGHLAMSVSASDFRRANIHLDELKGSLTGKSPAEVRNIIQHRIDRVQNVDIQEKPFSLFFMPFFSSRIEIDENFVTATASVPPLHA